MYITMYSIRMAHTTIRLPDELRAKLRREAEKRHMTQTQLIKLLVLELKEK